MVETGDAAPTVSSLEVGDAGDGYPAPAWKALGSSLCASMDEGPEQEALVARAQVWSSRVERSRGCT
jgi:hypothetical protein